MKLDKLVQLEKRFARILDRKLRDPGSHFDVLELIPMVLDDVEAHVLPTADGGRMFPYDRVSVQVAVEPSAAEGARAVLEHPPGLEERVRTRLAEARCPRGTQVEVAVRVIEGAAPEAWGELPFHLEYHARKRAKPAPVPEGPPRIRLAVISGSAAARNLVFELERVNVGRMARVEDRSHDSIRVNHVAFEEDGSDVNASVSRAHAHLEYDHSSGAMLLFDDGSAHGTRVLRGGRSLTVPRLGKRGVRLRDGDELEFGSARVKVSIAGPGRSG